MLAQILGIMGFILSVLTYQQNTHKRIVLLQFFSGICFTLHFYLLGAFTGAVLNAIGIVRSFVYCFKEQKWAASNLWIVFFSFVSIVAGIFTWESLLSLLPMLSMVLTGIAFGVNNPKITRRFALPASPLWLVYNVFNFSLGGILTEVFNILSVLIGMLRFDRKVKTEEVSE